MTPPRPSLRAVLGYAVIGTLFGFVITKGEVISWFRIQEMFRFQGFHMYGVFATALAVATPLTSLIKRGRIRSLSGETVEIPPKRLGRGIRYIAGGLLFGIGWALTGACPGPLFALLGSGIPSILVAIGFAIFGTWSYGVLRPRLPH